MKRLLPVISVFLSVTVCLLCGCHAENKKHAQIANAINNGAAFELKFLEDVYEKDLSALVPQYGCFGCDAYYNSGYTEGDEYYVHYIITAYPDYADGGSFVTRIECTDPNVTFFGGNTVENCEALFNYLSDEKFEIINTDDYPSSVTSAYKDKITVTYYRIPKKIIFSFEVSNRTGIDF